MAGEVVAWGDNFSGQLDIPDGLTAVAITTGYHSSFAILDDGSVVAWGDSMGWKLDIPEGLVAKQVAAGLNFALAICASDGRVVGWGSNQWEQCNVPAGLVAKEIRALETGTVAIALKEDGSVVGWGRFIFGGDNHGQLNIPDALVAKDIALGSTFGAAVRVDGTVAVWGTATGFDQSAVDALSDVVSISGKAAHLLALKSDGSVVAVGSNDYGECNVPAGLVAVAVSAGLNFSMALKADGSVVGWGSDYYDTLAIPEGLGAVAIACGESFTLAIRATPPVASFSATPVMGLAPLEVEFTDESEGIVTSWVWTFGDGAISRVQNPTHTYAFPGHYTVTLTVAGPGGEDSYSSVIAPYRLTLIAWGDNTSGQCNVPAGLVATQVSSIGDHTLALKPDGAVAAWGDNTSGQCNVPAGVVATQVAAGAYHSLALREDGSVVAWGLNDKGQCNVPGDLAGVVKIAAGGRHSLALKWDGSVVAWGSNEAIVQSVAGVWCDVIGGQRDVPAGLTGVVDIAAGYYHSVALKADGSIVTWGTSNFWFASNDWHYYTSRGLKDPYYMPYSVSIPSHLLAGGITAVSAGGHYTSGFGSYTAFLRSVGDIVIVDGYNYDGLDPDDAYIMPVPAGSTVTRMAAGGDAIFATLDDGSLISSKAIAGEIPVGAYLIDIAAGTSHAVAVGYLFTADVSSRRRKRAAWAAMERPLFL